MKSINANAGNHAFWRSTTRATRVQAQQQVSQISVVPTRRQSFVSLLRRTDRSMRCARLNSDVEADQNPTSQAPSAIENDSTRLHAKACSRAYSTRALS